MQENKIKTMKIFFSIFNEHLECGKRMERRWNAISRINQNPVSCMKKNYLLFKQMSMSTLKITQT